VCGTFDSDNIDSLGFVNPESPSLQSSLTTSNFHLFEPLKEHLEEQTFDKNDEHAHGVLNWLCG
jgi:hypothetical protein